MSAAAFTDRMRVLNAAARILSGDEFKLLDKLNRLTGSCGCRPGSKRLQLELGWKERKLEYQIGGLTGAPSACKSRSRIADRPAIMVCERKRYTDPVHKRVTWRRSFRIHWNVLAQLAGFSAKSETGLSAKSEAEKGGLSAKSCGVSSSGFESALQILQPETHTAREGEPDGGGSAGEGRVCFLSETEDRKAEANPKPEPEKPKPARQESDAGERRANGSPASRAADTAAKFAILCAAYGPTSQGFLEPARRAFAARVDEFEAILRHVNHTSEQRAQWSNPPWLSRYLELAPWRHVPADRAQAHPGESEEGFRHRRRVLGDDEAGTDTTLNETERRNLERLREQNAAREEVPADRSKVEAARQQLRELTGVKATHGPDPTYKRAEPVSVSISIEDKLRNAARMAAEGGVPLDLLDLARKLDREGRNEQELREVVARVLGEIGEKTC